MSKIIIAGSRGFEGYNLLEQIINDAGLVSHEDEIVSGGARGADTVGELYASSNGIKVSKFPADWNSYGKSAGHIRNKQMADYADKALVIWDGKSRGSHNMIYNMYRVKKPCIYVVYYKDAEGYKISSIYVMHHKKSEHYSDLEGLIKSRRYNDESTR